MFTQLNNHNAYRKKKSTQQNGKLMILAVPKSTYNTQPPKKYS